MAYFLFLSAAEKDLVAGTDSQSPLFILLALYITARVKGHICSGHLRDQLCVDPWDMHSIVGYDHSLQRAVGSILWCPCGQDMLLGLLGEHQSATSRWAVSGGVFKVKNGGFCHWILDDLIPPPQSTNPSSISNAWVVSYAAIFLGDIRGLSLEGRIWLIQERSGCNDSSGRRISRYWERKCLTCCHCANLFHQRLSSFFLSDILSSSFYLTTITTTTKGNNFIHIEFKFCLFFK